ncbi:MAG: Gfo/Idh/MocA family protein, partial [Candidatus Methylacidiphilales bacterium]
MQTVSQTNIGIIGCGNISNAYFDNCRLYPNITVAACADLDRERAEQSAAKHGIARALSVDEMLADPEVEIIINLTIPQAHAEIDCRVLEAGKHVFSEKPMALNLAEGRQIVDIAHKVGKRVGCAPDTVLGAGVQTSRKLIDDGAIGQPVAFAAAMQCRGHENWHPSPEFYYQKGGGPMFDMGPYYLHALITLLGPVKRVSGSGRISFPERIITSKPKNGQSVKVEVPTHLVSILEFANGVTGTFTTSFDVRGPSTRPVIEIYGSEGTLRVPDPNGTGGAVYLGAAAQNEWVEVPHTHPYAKGSRGLGVADMAAAIESGRKHRANEEIALHAL